MKYSVVLVGLLPFAFMVAFSPAISASEMSSKVGPSLDLDVQMAPSLENMYNILVEPQSIDLGAGAALDTDGRSMIGIGGAPLTSQPLDHGLVLHGGAVGEYDLRLGKST